MSPKEADLLHQWVSEALGGQKVTFKLLWQGSRDGFSASTFHTKCNGQGPTLSIGLSTFPKIFGGFTSADWDNNNKTSVSKDNSSYRSDSTAFIFSLTHRIKCAKQKNENSIYPDPNYGPIFWKWYMIYIFIVIAIKTIIVIIMEIMLRSSTRNR